MNTFYIYDACFEPFTDETGFTEITHLGDNKLKCTWKGYDVTLTIAIRRVRHNIGDDSVTFDYLVQICEFDRDKMSTEVSDELLQSIIRLQSHRDMGSGKISLKCEIVDAKESFDE